jgi:hypothetical protein
MRKLDDETDLLGLEFADVGLIGTGQDSVMAF